MSTSKNSRPASSRSPADFRRPTVCLAKSRSANAICSGAGKACARRCNTARARAASISRFVEPYLHGISPGARARRIRPGDHLVIVSVLYVENVSAARSGSAFRLPTTLSTQMRYSAYRQEIALPANLNNCNNISPDFVNYVPDAGRVREFRRPICRGWQPGSAKLLLRRRSLAGDPPRTRAGRGADLAGWLQPDLQYPRQQPQPDQRHYHRLQAGFRRRSAATCNSSSRRSMPGTTLR